MRAARGVGGMSRMSRISMLVNLSQECHLQSGGEEKISLPSLCSMNERFTSDVDPLHQTPLSLPRSSLSILYEALHTGDDSITEKSRC